MDKLCNVPSLQLMVYVSQMISRGYDNKNIYAISTSKLSNLAVVCIFEIWYIALTKIAALEQIDIPVLCNHLTTAGNLSGNLLYTHPDVVLRHYSSTTLTVSHVALLGLYVRDMFDFFLKHRGTA